MHLIHYGTYGYIFICLLALFLFFLVFVCSQGIFNQKSKINSHNLNVAICQTFLNFLALGPIFGTGFTF